MKKPRQTYFNAKSNFPKAQKSIVNNCINELVQKGAVVKCRKVKNQFLSPYFVRQKPDGSYRFILNLKKLNKYVNTEHFKIEDLKIASKLISKNDFMFSLDLQDAYLMVPVHLISQKYLSFKFGKSYNKFIVLLFGLCSSPYIFIKIMKPVVKYLR